MFTGLRRSIRDARTAVRDVIAGVRNVVRWLPVIWSDGDWDHAFLATIIATKLRFMARHHALDGVGTNHWKIAAELYRAAYLIEHADDAAWCENDYWKGGLTYDPARSRRYLDGVLPHIAAQDADVVGLGRAAAARR